MAEELKISFAIPRRCMSSSTVSSESRLCRRADRVKHGVPNCFQAREMDDRVEVHIAERSFGSDRIGEVRNDEPQFSRCELLHPPNTFRAPCREIINNYDLHAVLQ